MESSIPTAMESPTNIPPQASPCPVDASNAASAIAEVGPPELSIDDIPAGDSNKPAPSTQQQQDACMAFIERVIQKPPFRQAVLLLAEALEMPVPSPEKVNDMCNMTLEMCKVLAPRILRAKDLMGNPQAMYEEILQARADLQLCMMRSLKPEAAPSSEKTPECPMDPVSDRV